MHLRYVQVWWLDHDTSANVGGEVRPPMRVSIDNSPGHGRYVVRPVVVEVADAAALPVRARILARVG